MENPHEEGAPPSELSGMVKPRLAGSARLSHLATARFRDDPSWIIRVKLEPSGKTIPPLKMEMRIGKRPNGEMRRSISGGWIETLCSPREPRATF